MYLSFNTDLSGIITQYKIFETEVDADAHSNIHGMTSGYFEGSVNPSDLVWSEGVLTLSPPTPNAQQIKEEANSRISSVMPTWIVDRANSGGPRIPANVLAYVKSVRETSDVLEGTLPTDYTDDSHWPPVPDPIVFEDAPVLTRKDDVWERCTEAEAELIMAALDQAPAKLRGMWMDNPYISHSHSQFDTLRDSLIEILGGGESAETRADEILAESEML